MDAFNPCPFNVWAWDYWRHLSKPLCDLALPQIGKLLPEQVHDDSERGEIRYVLVADDRLRCAERSRKLECELHDLVECNDGLRERAQSAS